MANLFDDLDRVLSPGASPVPDTLPAEPRRPEGGAIVLRDYQLDVVARARSQVGNGLKRGIIQSETGGGKTVIGGEFCRASASKGKRTIMIADRRRLIGQFGECLKKFGIEYGVLMSGETRRLNAPVILASRDTIASWSARPEFDLPHADLVIVDECHKSMGNTYRTLLDRYSNAVAIGLTATPARGDGKSLGGWWEWLECTVPASQLIAEGWLIKPEVYAPIELAEKRKIGTKTRGLAGCPVSHWRKHAEGLPTIAFAKSRAESLLLCDQFNAAGIRAEHVDANTSDESAYGGLSDREKAYDRLQAGRTQVLCSVKLLIEGIDIPEVSAAILWAPFGSLIEYRQACGRIMRPAAWAGKTRAVVLDHAGAAGIHGLPGDDVAWSLDTTTISERHEKDPNKPTTHFCAKCGMAFQSLPACPSCGWRLPRESKPVPPGESIWEARDELLSRFTAEPGAATGPDIVAQARNQHWRRCIAAAVNKGAKVGMAVMLFQKRFGVTPWSAGVFPMPSDRGDWKRPAAEVFPGFGKKQGTL